MKNRILIFSIYVLLILFILAIAVVSLLFGNRLDVKLSNKKIDQIIAQSSSPSCNFVNIKNKKDIRIKIVEKIIFVEKKEENSQNILNKPVSYTYTQEHDKILKYRTSILGYSDLSDTQKTSLGIGVSAVYHNYVIGINIVNNKTLIFNTGIEF